MSLKLKNSEKIYHIVRRYGLTLLWWWLLIVVLIIVPFFFMFWLFQKGWWGIMLFILPLSIAAIILFRVLYFWQKNLFYVTSHRLVDIEQRGLFDKIISEINYDQIEDVSGRVKGFCGTIFRYGEISVQVGNGKIKILATKVKDPWYLQEQINGLRDRWVNQSAKKFSNNAMQTIIDQLYELEPVQLLRVKKEIEKRLETED